MSAIRFVRDPRRARRAARRLHRHGPRRHARRAQPRRARATSPRSPPLEIVLSGGVALLDDLRRLPSSTRRNVVGVIVGRALYEKAFTLADALAVFAG